MGESDSTKPFDIMNSDCVTQDEVAKAGSKLLVMLYSGKVNDKLDSLRYAAYMSMCSTGTSRPTPERLPPTERAAYYHCLRGYHQVFQWCLKTVDLEISALDWG